MSVRLREVLAKVGKHTESYETPDGTRILLLPYGARILGLYAAGNDDNFFWTHPGLDEVDSARTLFNGAGWHNSGGERTWLAPEVDIFFPDFPDTSTHRPPVELDASEYRVERSHLSVRMERKINLHLARSRRDVELVVAKSVNPAANPLRHDSHVGDENQAVQYAGFTQRTSLKLIQADDQTQLGLWNLIQLPFGGEILVPTFSPASVRVLFGIVPSQDLVVTDHLTRFKLCSPGENKIAIRALATTGRAGYLTRSSNLCELVIRNFFVNPSGEYVDCPKDDTQDIGFAFQAVGVDSSLGRFGELEYHVPALKRGAVPSECEDISQVWAFRGPSRAILDIARRLLAPEI